MSLQSGSFLIRSKSANLALVGRQTNEDKSLNPKGILRLPEDFSPRYAQWEITRTDNGTYILKTRGSHATDIDGRLFGVLLDEPAATEWKIQRQPRHGTHVFTIVKADSIGYGWVTPEKEDEQILVRILIVGPSDPPFYPPNELFEIIPAD